MKNTVASKMDKLAAFKMVENELSKIKGGAKESFDRSKPHIPIDTTVK